MSTHPADKTKTPAQLAIPTLGAMTEYWIDAAQRSILFWDVLRRRGNAYKEHATETVPHVLDYDVELVSDGRTFERPVNYGLARIVPPKNITIDLAKRPFVVIDPRAGHGPGIGGFKADSEIGVALKAGHPCYFIGFAPEPMAGQTIEDILHAEATFLEIVIERHPQAEGKPCVIGNCQAGWALMMLAALRPELFGPLIVAGSPLSYWAGVHGKNPMRYTGGLLGGSWLTAFASDLGAGQFDGAGLVQNFENLNPSNTLWAKQYNLYSKVDSEAERYLDFERWWGGHVYLNGEEIQFIVDQLFVGNNLAAGRVQTSDGTSIDLRNIRSPIVIFCSKGDNITPPQQALDWILDLYDDADQIRSYGQTIVYTVHDTAGHLGIFVSGSVAKKEHSEFSGNIDLIDVLPPGLYEAVLTPNTGADASDLVSGDWIMRCEARTLDDIRALGCNDAADERCFETVARISEINRSLYRSFMQPLVRTFMTPQTAELTRRMHPLRLQYELFASTNPAMAWIEKAAQQARQARKPVAANNSLLAIQETTSRLIVDTLDLWRDVGEKMSESVFLSVYGSPLLQAAVGVDPASAGSWRKTGRNPLHAQLIEKRIAELKSRMHEGGLPEATARAFLYVGMSRSSVDERGFESIRRFRRSQTDRNRRSLAAFKAMIRDQFFMLLIDREAAIQAIPELLPEDSKARHQAIELIKQVITSSAALPPEGEIRLREIAALFEVEDASSPKRSPRTAERPLHS